MMIIELTRMLTKETQVTVKDKKTRKTVWEGTASEATFNDQVKDWDFSVGHIIYI